jgi:hypothetical protein
MEADELQVCQRGGGERRPHATAFRLALLLAGVLGAGAAHALNLGLDATGAFNTHGMEFWNDDLVQANGTGARFPPLRHTITYALGLRAWSGPRWLLQVGWEPLRLSSSDPPTGRKLAFDTESYRLDLTWFPPQSGRVLLGLGGGLGYYRLHGRRELGGIKNADLTGHTFGAQFEGVAEWPLTRWAAVSAAAGYRHARLAHTEVNGQAQDPPIETNYSGFLARLGLALSPPRRV